MYYNVGVNRIFYKSLGFAAGKTVTAYIWNPSLVKSALQTFTELESGLYYLDYDFSVAGAYAGLFYEDGSVSIPGFFMVGTLIELAADDVAAALLASKGVTEGGVWTYQKLLKIIAAWMLGLARDKTGSPGVQEILDPDNGTTVIAEVQMSTSTPYRTLTVKI